MTDSAVLTTTPSSTSSTHMSDEEPHYFPPRKVILTKENLEAFQQSKTHETIVPYINSLNECIVGVKLTDDVPVSTVRKFVLVVFEFLLILFLTADCSAGTRFMVVCRP